MTATSTTLETKPRKQNALRDIELKHHCCRALEYGRRCSPL